MRLGDLLVAAGEITEAELEQALALQKANGHKLGRILVEQGFVEEDALLGFLSTQLGIPFVDLANYELDHELVTLLPETQSRRYRALVLAQQEDGLLVGMADPIDIFAYDEIARRLDQPVNVAVVRETDLMMLLDSAYRRTHEIEGLAHELDGELSIDEFKFDSYQNDEDDTPVARLLQSILKDAVQIRASDVHIEPGEKVLRLRFRVDGVLQEQILPEVRIAAALISRLKLLAGLDISEKRLPQDGKFEHRLSDRSLDVRLSTLPTTFGESLVMRLVDHASAPKDLTQIGMADDLVKRFRKLVNRPNGLILVTGPTGSGKTTTLYGALQEQNSETRKIITVEDPVEIKLERVNQVQVNPKIGLGFAQVLRSSLRQDPDVILVGEIRDHETAEIALRAAMTGHVVLSTLHTNDAISSAIRLIDIGVPGYMVASSVRGILAQRLIRRVCEKCKAVTPPDAQELEWLRGIGSANAGEDFVRGAGCNHCNQTGYFGRVGVFELLEMSSALADALRRNDSEAFARLAVQQEGFTTLVEQALATALAGVTSLAEVMSLSGHVEEVDEQTPEQLEDVLVAKHTKFELQEDLRH
ncbi:MAG: ATPase, T2SS/T4P/T4SS family [Pseudomonadales bacterium]